MTHFKRVCALMTALLCLLAIGIQPAAAAQGTDEAAENFHFVSGDEPGTLLTVITGVPEDTVSVECTVWCEHDDRSSYPAQKQEDGSWELLISSADHNYRTGEYKLIAWMQPEEGSRTVFGTACAQLAYTGGILETQVMDPEESRIQLCLKAQLPQGAPVWFRVSPLLSPENAQAYFGYPAPDGSYLGTMIPARHGFAGTYRIEAYIASTLIAASSLELTGCTDASVTAEVTDQTGGVFAIHARAEAPSGIHGLTAAVWASADQSDIIWYEMQESDGSWTVQDSTAFHGHRFGPYTIHIYADLGNGLRALAASYVYELTPSGYMYAEMYRNSARNRPCARYRCADAYLE